MIGRARITAALALAALALVLGVACSDSSVAGSRQPIVGGTVDAGDPAIVALVIPWGTSYWSTCTGTLVGERDVLTASHCIEERIGNITELSIYFGTDVTQEGLVIPVAAGQLHRYWGDGDPRYDIAMLHLAAPAPAEITPITINDRALDDSFIGGDIRVVGYGLTSADGDDNGLKREGMNVVRTYTPEFIYLEEGDVGVCFGDSGGPALHDFGDGEVQVGIAALTWACEMAGETRVDVHLDSFVWPFIDRHSGPCALDGACVTDCPRSPDPDCDSCLQDGVCASGCPFTDWDCPLGKAVGDSCTTSDDCEARICESAPEDARVKYCTRPCAGDDCPAAMTCSDPDSTRSRCIFDTPTPGVLGAACTLDDTCRSGICDERVCVERCDEVAGGGCPEPFVCRIVAARGFEVCGPELADDGGCKVAPGARPGALPGLLLLLALLMVRPRRRRRGHAAAQSTKLAQRGLQPSSARVAALSQRRPSGPALAVKRQPGAASSPPRPAHSTAAATNSARLMGWSSQPRYVAPARPRSSARRQSRAASS